MTDNIPTPDDATPADAVRIASRNLAIAKAHAALDVATAKWHLRRAEWAAITEGRNAA